MCFVLNIKKYSERQEQTLTVQSETKTAFSKRIIYLLQQQGHTIHSSKYPEVFTKNNETQIHT